MELLIELFDDGGIRVVPPPADGQPGMATVAAMVKWVDFASAKRYAVRVAGRVSSPMARSVVDLLPAGVPHLTFEETEPVPWHAKWTSLMWAADHGLVDETVDLLQRGSSSKAPRRFALSPYRLAMRRGHVPVMAALRAGGARDPVRARPPGAPDAIVMRPYVGWVFGVLAPLPLIIGVVLAIVTRSWIALAAGVIGAIAIAAIGALADLSAGRTVVAVDGSRLYYRRFRRWRGPVDLTKLVAIGIRESAHRRTPALLRLANVGEGEPPSRPTTRAGFDPEIVEALRAQPDVRVLTVYMTSIYLRPGLERYVAGFVDSRRTLVSTSAKPLVEAVRSKQPATP